eukprot:TRINITY_DN37991_c0_g1_i1.p1 TRINITY_DN37991_c0_g1~~TRINITY_DN37991_c0_g1_i1.p1  ORF type:complete len:342 (-),score=25.64 TRINITY_DN37991_c0_g1_i1:347-1345(-)
MGNVVRSSVFLVWIASSAVATPKESAEPDFNKWFVNEAVHNERVAEGKIVGLKPTLLGGQKKRGVQLNQRSNQIAECTVNAGDTALSIGQIGLLIDRSRNFCDGVPFIPENVSDGVNRTLLVIARRQLLFRKAELCASTIIGAFAALSGVGGLVASMTSLCTQSFRAHAFCAESASGMVAALAGIAASANAMDAICKPLTFELQYALNLQESNGSTIAGSRANRIATCVMNNLAGVTSLAKLGLGLQRVTYWCNAGGPQAGPGACSLGLLSLLRTLDAIAQVITNVFVSCTKRVNIHAACAVTAEIMANSIITMIQTSMVIGRECVASLNPV